MSNAVKIGNLCLELGDKFISITDSGGGYDHLEIEASEQNLRELKAYFDLLLKVSYKPHPHENLRSLYTDLLREGF